MGFMDLFRKDDPPLRKMMRMPLAELRAKAASIDLDLDDLVRRIKKAREEFDALIEKGRDATSDNDQRLLASRAKEVRRRIELMQRDFDGLRQAHESAVSLVMIREGLGDNATRVEKELAGLAGLSSRELALALDERARGYETARERMRETDRHFASYTDGRSEEDESEELNLMRRGREPALGVAPPRPRTTATTPAREEGAQEE